MLIAVSGSEWKLEAVFVFQTKSPDHWTTAANR